MVEEERVTSLLSISTKPENLLESKKRWGDVFLPSTRGKECLLVIARGGADLFKYLIEEVSFFFAKEHVEICSTLGLGGREMWEFSQLYVFSRGQVKASCCCISYEEISHEEIGAGVVGIAVLPLYSE